MYLTTYGLYSIVPSRTLNLLINIANTFSTSFGLCYNVLSRILNLLTNIANAFSPSFGLYSIVPSRTLDLLTNIANAFSASFGLCSIVLNGILNLHLLPNVPNAFSSCPTTYGDPVVCPSLFRSWLSQLKILEGFRYFVDISFYISHLQESSFHLCVSA